MAGPSLSRQTVRAVGGYVTRGWGERRVTEHAQHSFDQVIGDVPTGLVVNGGSRSQED
jgi:hypothetical protein